MLKFGILEIAGVRSHGQGPYHAGWMINPKLFGDGRTWSYGFWKGANGAGCYNTRCPEFLFKCQKLNSLGHNLLTLKEKRDKNSGNWWLSDVNLTTEDDQIGYWPKELFDLIRNSVDMIGVGGIVQASPSGVSPPMGNGHKPTEDVNAAARVMKLEIVDSNYKIQESDKYKLEKLLDSAKCYGLKDGKGIVLFSYGGPGGHSCGI
ncbi:hypothetical protein AT5G04937 [Arabidopsis thaliana]|uniref:Neprosin PEP catalytic domain-containing protein n=2 Tax=Arabidopsis thaliana TaxID=3702 RepID=A0A1P8BDW2_ARATH|nr:uncharacterized protein AT5G04937 [Arabidopsis thaliana]ANM69792.1 hypothetical protein AT5G04937 [Arabidopsis thaliana]CAA0400716.1 unnamed protein product [Arabidopsis thaliana]|eukprot:NP_001331445.1 hypothetical protein AT5G04937 [Arabidopsis thaliana]